MDVRAKLSRNEMSIQDNLITERGVGGGKHKNVFEYFINIFQAIAIPPHSSVCSTMMSLVAGFSEISMICVGKHLLPRPSLILGTIPEGLDIIRRRRLREGERRPEGKQTSWY